MPKILRLMADYHCFPLWKPGSGEYYVGPDGLPLSDGLKATLQTWADVYDRTLNEDYPPDSRFSSPTEEEAFETEGRRLWQALKNELGEGYKVLYYSIRDGKLYE